MKQLILEQLTRLGVEVHHQNWIPNHLARYASSETNALYVKHHGKHQIYFFREHVDLHILAHEAIHFLQNSQQEDLVLATEEELLVGFPKYWQAVCKAYKSATRRELLQETEAHIFQQYPELVLERLQLRNYR